MGWGGGGGVGGVVGGGKYLNNFCTNETSFISFL